MRVAGHLDNTARSNTASSGAQPSEQRTVHAGVSRRESCRPCCRPNPSQPSGGRPRYWRFRTRSCCSSSASAAGMSACPALLDGRHAFLGSEAADAAHRRKAGPKKTRSRCGCKVPGPDTLLSRLRTMERAGVRRGQFVTHSKGLVSWPRGRGRAAHRRA
eukprot:scaffold9936_cov130-Isochrysis_galbana.AAC.10